MVRTAAYCGLLILPGLAQADLYKCARPDGSVSYQGAPCEGRERVLDRRVDAPRPPPEAVTAGQPPGPETMLARARIMEGMLVAQSVKLQITEFYMTNGRLPSSNAMLGLPPARDYVRNAITGLEVMTGGAIVMRFNGQSGVEGGELRLKPDVSKPHMGIAWQCTTPSFRDIAAWAPDCRYTGRP